MMGVAFQASRSNLFFSILLFTMYALGHCAVIVAGGSLTGWVKAYLAWNEKNGTLSFIKTVCGVLVAAGGAFLIKNSLFG
jgi:cytochrome c-type biogenesis protein